MNTKNFINTFALLFLGSLEAINIEYYQTPNGEFIHILDANLALSKPTTSNEYMINIFGNKISNEPIAFPVNYEEPKEAWTSLLNYIKSPQRPTTSAFEGNKASFAKQEHLNFEVLKANNVKLVLFKPKGVHEVDLGIFENTSEPSQPLIFDNITNLWHPLNNFINEIEGYHL